MSYLRPMGDGPITHPGEDDEVPVIPPTRVDCEDLPADSPWRKPGQVCANAPVPTIFDPVIDIISQAFDKPPTGTPANGTGSGIPSWALLAGLGVGAYYFFRKRS